MPSRRSKETTPDLFSAPPSADMPPQPAAAARYLLPKDLAGSLGRLNDHEFDTLLAAVSAESERRGRAPKAKPRAQAQEVPRGSAVEEFAVQLTKAKLNAINAAFKAGVKPSAIARQFGISQSDVRKALSNAVPMR